MKKVDNNKLGMGLFLISESAFFVFLILAYVYFRYSVKAGPTAANSLDPAKTGIFTIFLFASSLTIWLAERSLRAGRQARLHFWLFVTIVFGAVFLVGQGMEYLRLYRVDVTVSRNLFGTTFFTLTGFHGLHVFLGLIALTVLLGLSLAGQFRAPRSAAVETVAMYWHFVDGVWVVLFAVIYLWALL